MNPSVTNCIYSTLIFVCDHADRYGVDPIVTFDQPLWFKAMTIIESQTDSSKLSSVVLRLGGFHTLMSFLGSIGHLMAGTGLQELLEMIYAPNAVTHIFSGKPVARAIRGHILVDTALHAVLVANIFGIKQSRSSPSDPGIQYDDELSDDDKHPTADEDPDDYEPWDMPPTCSDTSSTEATDDENSIPDKLEAL